MTTALVLGGTLGLGLWLIVAAQPVGRRRPDLAARLARLTAQGRHQLDHESSGTRADRVFLLSTLEATLRPLLDDLGRLIGRLVARMGLGTDLERRLALGWPELGPAQYYGQKLATGMVGLVTLPVFNALGLTLSGPWPVWTWLACFAVGFAAPDWVLATRLERRRTRVVLALPTAVDLLAITASAGLSPEQALAEAARQAEGPLGDGLREVTRESGLGVMSSAEGLRVLAEREGVPELGALADAWQAAQEQGTALGGTMLTLAATVRERQRVKLLEEGSKSTVRMLFPVALFIFPVFLVVLLYPAGVALLGIGG